MAAAAPVGPAVHPSAAPTDLAATVGEAVAAASVATVFTATAAQVGLAATAGAAGPQAAEREPQVSAAPVGRVEAAAPEELAPLRTGPLASQVLTGRQRRERGGQLAGQRMMEPRWPPKPPPSTPTTATTAPAHQSADHHAPTDPKSKQPEP